jgi:hypothetical protein
LDQSISIEQWDGSKGPNLASTAAAAASADDDDDNGDDDLFPYLL